MKNVFHSPEIFHAYAMIDLCYYELNEIYKDASKPKDAITMMIDKATGYSKSQDKKRVKKSIELLESIIENKKIIGADFESDIKTLNEIKTIENINNE